MGSQVLVGRNHFSGAVDDAEDITEEVISGVADKLQEEGERNAATFKDVPNKVSHVMEVAISTIAFVAIAAGSLIAAVLAVPVLGLYLVTRGVAKGKELLDSRSRNERAGSNDGS